MMSGAMTRTVRDFSFIKDGRWSPVRTGRSAIDNEHGRACADEVLAFIAETNNPAIFGSVIRAITEGGVYCAVEIGFCSRIGIYMAVNSQRS